MTVPNSGAAGGPSGGPDRRPTPPYGSAPGGYAAGAPQYGPPAGAPQYGPPPGSGPGPQYGPAPQFGPPGYAPPPGYGPAQPYGSPGYAPPNGDGPPPQSRPETGGSGGWFSSAGAPRQLRPVVVLLLINLTLSVAVTIATIALKNSIVEFQLDHRNVPPEARELVRASYSGAIVGRVIGNVAASIVYTFLVRALFRGRRWAYRRVILLGAIGGVALLAQLASPYPAWLHVEQVLQAIVLAALVYFVLRPEVRAHFDPSLPGRTARRFNR